MSTARRLVAIIASAIVLATACTSSSSDETSTADTAAEASTTTDAATGTSTEAPSTTDAALSATDTGVTAESIKVAAVFPDVSAIGREPGDVEAKWRAAIDAVNDAGGVNGRRIDLVFSLYQPIGDVEADAVCIRNAEDEQVFAVIGVLLRENSACYTDAGVITVNTFPTTSELYARAEDAPLIGVEPLSERLVEQNVRTLIDAGHLAPGMAIAVHGLAAKQDLHDTYLAVLADRGVDVVAATLRSIDDDQVEAAAEVAVFAERWMAEGAEAILGSAPESASDLVGAYDSAGIELPMLLPENSHVEPSLMVDTFGFDLAPLQLAVVLVRDSNAADLYPDNIAGVTDCVDRFEAASGESVNLDSSGDGADNLVPTIAACQSVEIFAAIAEAAGADLTTESFTAAAEAFGAIEVTAVIEGSLGPGKFDISDTAAVIGTYDPETRQFVVS